MKYLLLLILLASNALLITCNNALTCPETPKNGAVAPRVIYTFPGDKMEGIAIDSSILVAFDKSMDASSITTKSFTVKDDLLGTCLEGSYACYDDRVIVFTPDRTRQMKADWHYVVTLHTSIKDKSGLNLSKPGSFIFRTKAAVDSVDPFVQEAKEEQSLVKITFNENMNPATLTGSASEEGSEATITLQQENGPFIEGSIGLLEGSKIITFAPHAPLEPGNFYRLTIKSGDQGVKDLAGRTLANNVDYSYLFHYYPQASDRSMFMAVGTGGKISTSLDGIYWKNQVLGGDDLWDVAYGNGRFVAVGANGRRIISFDGEIWENDITGGERLYDIAFGNGCFVAVGINGRRIVSLDGINWTNEITDGKELHCIAFGNDRFVAAGENGRRIVSFDGINWQDDIYGGNGFVDIAFGDKIFIAVGGDGRRVISSDGITWEHDISGGTSLQGVTYGNNVFIAVGPYKRRVISKDGITWDHDISENGDGFYRIVYGNGIFVANGYNESRIITTDSIDWFSEGGNNSEESLVGIIFIE